jgi:hypothetical protein
MRSTTYSKYTPEAADTVNLQALLDELGDFLLQSGFAGGPGFWHDDMGEPDRSMDALRQAILQALMDSGQLTPDMLKVLRGESTGDAKQDQQIQQQLAQMLDHIVQRLVDEGYLKVEEAPQVPSGYQSHVRARRAGARGCRTGAVRADREGRRSARLQDAQEPARQLWASRALARTTRRSWPPASRPSRRASSTNSATR